MAFVVIVLPLMACGYRERSYQGDGTLTDRGWYSGSDRYVLDLGMTDLTTAGSRAYTMANLPPERVAVGFQLLPRSSTEKLGQDHRLPFNPIVRLRLTSSSTVLINDERPLNDWILSTVGSNSYPVFAYCPGAHDGWNDEPGTAWGCIFKPKANERYTLAVEVVRPDPGALPFAINLLIKGGSGLAS
jgi:hypothetical protein